MLRATILFATVLSGCATPEQVKALDERVAQLEEKVEALASAPAAKKAATTADPAQEEEAKKLLEESFKAANDLRMEEAKKAMDTLQDKFGSTSAARRGKRMASELAVIGKAAPTDFTMDQWFQGEGEVDLTGPTPTLVVFWEKWCPHCQKEVPKLEKTHQDYKGRMNVIGLTKLSKGVTAEDVNTFISEKEVSYPMAKENGDVSKHFAVQGIPAAALVKDGKIIWRGHPAGLNDEKLDKLL